MIFGSVIDAKEDPKRGPTPPLLERSSAEEFALIAVVRFSLLSISFGLVDIQHRELTVNVLGV